METSPLAKELRKISILGKLAEALIASENLHEFFTHLYDKLTEFIPADQVLLFLHDEVSKSFYLSPDLNPSTINLQRKQDRLEYGETEFVKFLRGRSPILRVQQHDNTFTEAEISVFGQSIRAEMAVPVRTQHGEVIGVLHFGRANPIGFNKAQKAIATVAAAFIANLIEKDRLYAQNAQLQEKERWWHSYFEILFHKISGPCCVIDDKDGLIYQMNQAFAEMMKYPATELEGRPIFELFLRKDQEKLKAALNDLMIGTSRLVKKLHLADLSKGPGVVHVKLAKIPNTPHILVRLFDSRSRTLRLNRMIQRWQHLNEIFSQWQNGLGSDDFNTAIEKGLRLLGESLHAKYVALFKSSGAELQILSMINLDSSQRGQPARAWRAGLEQGPYTQLSRATSLEFHSNILEHPLFEKWKPIARQLGCTSMLTLPLRIHNEAVGLACLYFRQKQKLDPVEKEFALACGNYLATVLDYSRSQRLARLRSDHIKVIEAFTNKINAKLDLEEVIKAAAEGIRKIMSFDVLDVTLFDSEGEKVKLYSIMSRRLSQQLNLDSWRGFSQMEDYGWLCLGEAGDPETHARIEELVHSKRNVLLMASDKYLGTMEVSCMEADAFTPSTYEFLSQIAGQLAIAIENARLFDKLNMRVKELSAIARASWAAAADIDIHSMITNIAQSVQRALSARAVWYQLLYRHPEIPDRIEVGEAEGELNLARHSEIAEKLLNQKQYVAVAWTEEGLKISKNQIGLGLLVPVVLHHQTVGFLCVQWKQTRRITRREIELIRTMANLISTAIENERLRQESSQRTLQLERVNDELEKFVYTVSHDLKSPIVSIQGFTSILLDDYGKDMEREARHYLERIQKNAQAMERLVKDLLELSRIGRSAQKFEKLSAREIVERALIEFSYQIKKENITVDIQENLPEVVGDATQLTQVFANLIGNAIKFMDPDKVEYRIEIGGKREDEAVVLWVKDNGVGIAPEHREKIFDLFERCAHGKKIEGSGVGLTIVKRIVEQHKGQIWVESRIKEGATFFVKLPATPGGGNDANPQYLPF